MVRWCWVWITVGSESVTDQTFPLSVLYNSETIKNILMILRRIIEQVNAESHTQEG